MKKSYIILGILLAVVLFIPTVLFESLTFESSYTSDTTAATEDLSSQLAITGLLSRIEYNNNVAYIFGSLHGLRDSWLPLHPMVESAMRRADQFGFEVNMYNLANLTPTQLAYIDNLQRLPEGVTLADFVPTEIYENFRANIDTFGHMGITYDLINMLRLNPVTITNLISQMMLQMYGDLTISVMDSVDGYIFQFALDNNKPFFGFETIEGQANLLFGVPLELQAYALYGFNDFETALYEMSSEDDILLISAYENNDFDTLRRLLSEDSESDENAFTEHFHYVMLNYRCHIYAEGIADLLRNTEEPTTFFFTFGAAHIIGQGGGMVLELLYDMGFTIDPLWKGV